MFPLKYVLHRLAGTPGFTTVALLTLTLGIGVSTAFFSILDRIWLRALIFPEQDRLVSLVERSGPTVHDAANYENFLDWRDRQHSFSALGAARTWSADLAGPAEPEQLSGAQVTFDYLLAAGVAPLRGRLFTREDDQPKAERTAIISEALWSRLYHRSDGVIGARVTLRGQPYTIIGVLPRGFIEPATSCAFWVPVSHFDWDYRDHTPRSPAPFAVLGRLRPGVDLAAARRDMDDVARQLEQTQPALQLGRGVVVTPLTERVFGRTRPLLLVLLAAAGGVFLISCANLAGLQLARTLARGREFAVRAALGAGRGQIASLVLTECVVLGLLGGAGGWLLAWWTVAGARSWLPAQFPRLDALGLDGRAVAWALGAAFAAVLVAGLVPVWRLTRTEARAALGGRSGTSGRADGSRWHEALIVAQMAATVVLLVGTGLMLRTLHQLYRADLGFNPANVVSFSWSPPLQAPGRPELVARVTERLAALPGVLRVGMISEMPLGGNYFTRPIRVEGASATSPGEHVRGSSFMVNVDAFAALGLPLLSGRPFTIGDQAPGAPPVTVIDALFAAQCFPGQNPVGRRINFGMPNEARPWVEIVGVVEHMENRGIGQDASVQSYLPSPRRGPPPNLNFILRTEGDPAQLLGAIRQTMRELAPNWPIYGLGSMVTRFDATIAPQRLAGRLLAGFAGLGLLLGGIGLYGALSYQVGQRTREIGIRLAVGAQPESVRRMILGQSATLAGLGLLLGSAAAFGGVRLLRALLYATSPGDPLTLAGAAGLLLGVALLAGWVPARRATRVNPVEALRTD
jgi:putative ABC transport system permease protein